jgi:hypothetical protein
MHDDVARVPPKRCTSKDADMCIIPDPPALAAAFACAVTVRTKPDRLVARNGDLSIFSAFNRIFPQVRSVSHLLDIFSIQGKGLNIFPPYTGLPERLTKAPHQGKNRSSRIQQITAKKVRLSMHSVQEETTFKVTRIIIDTVCSGTHAMATHQSSQKYIAWALPPSFFLQFS